MHKFAHIADCHVGAQSKPELRKMELKSFEAAFDRCIEEEVDFIIIAGDLFDSNLPNMEAVNESVKIMKRVKDSGIPIYVIYGSHDFSPNETSIIDVLASTGLLTRITNARVEENSLKLAFTLDPKTGAKLTGLPARKTGLEKHYFDVLDRDSLEKEDGFKIFAFHSAIDELKPEIFTQMASIPVSVFPKGFDYYAGGHVHKKVVEEMKNYGRIAFPGPLFAGYPKDLERSARGEVRGFFIVEFDEVIKEVRFVEMPLYNYYYCEYDASDKRTVQVQEELTRELEKIDVKDKIVILKIFGELSAGKTAEISFTRFSELLKSNGALDVSINRYGLRSREFQSFQITGQDYAEIEGKLFRENIGNLDTSLKELQGESGVSLARNLLAVLKQHQQANEKKKDYQERMSQQVIDILSLKEMME
ncbi:MAG: exonuclease SbcCD subunit D [Candidatus Odinarchaeota archaeon]